VEMHLAKVSITWHITGLIFLSFTKDWKLMMNPIRRLTRKGKFRKYGMQIAINSIKSRLLHKLWDILEDRKGFITRRDALASKAQTKTMTNDKISLREHISTQAYIIYKTKLLHQAGHIFFAKSRDFFPSWALLKKLFMYSSKMNSR